MKWDLKYFKDTSGHKLRYGLMIPEKFNALIVILPGRTEFIEKYTETALNCADRGYAVACLDWYGQGGSDRPLSNPHKHHSNGFDKDIQDLNDFVTHRLNIFKDKPKALLAHSMGGHLALRYMHDHPGDFMCAGLSAPMMHINTGYLPKYLANFIAQSLYSLGFENSYIPGGQNWQEATCAKASAKFTFDSNRSQIHNEYCVKNSVLQLGEPTIGWLKHALDSCKVLNTPDYLEQIKTPLFVGIAKNDHFVCNTHIRKALEYLNASSIELSPSGHEILMEKDEIRDQFLNSFFHTLNECLKDHV